jgi:hypothetical protein
MDEATQDTGTARPAAKAGQPGAGTAQHEVSPAGRESGGTPPDDGTSTSPAAEAGPAPADAENPSAPALKERAGLAGRIPGWLIAGAIYLAGAVAMWWHVWSGHPTSTMTCDCGDPASFVWFLAWPAYAISHGHSLFLATQSHFPGGINLLDNTSELALGVLFAPITWLFGPIAALNVALTAAPSATALTTYGAVRRGLGLSWPAAFLAGLMFGFSPFMLRNEAASHIQTSFLVLLPLIFWCCYELTVTQRGTWLRWGLGLGVLVALQFFVGSDILLVTAISTGLALALAFSAALARTGVLSAKLPFAGRGFVLAGVVAGALLAYPMWFALAGPQHIKGANWWNAAGSGLRQILFPVGPAPFARAHWPVEGYLGPVGTFEGYLGILALVILAVTVVAVRRPLARLCAAMTFILIWLSLGASYLPYAKGGEPAWLPLPWQAVAHVPVLDKMTPTDFGAAAAWFVAVAGALLMDRILPRRRPGAGQPVSPLAGDAAAVAASPAQARRVATPAASQAQARAFRVAAAGLLGAALVLPWVFSWRMPFTTKAVSTPAWVVHSGTHLARGTVVLFYPFPASYQDQALVWQARYGMPYAVVGGRGITAGPGGAADHGWTPGTPEGTMTALSVPWEPHYAHLKLPSPPGPATVRSFRGALRSWQVTDVVVMPEGRDPGYARQWLTTVLGTPPRLEYGAWVWTNVQQLIS